MKKLIAILIVLVIITITITSLIGCKNKEEILTEQKTSSETHIESEKLNIEYYARGEWIEWNNINDVKEYIVKVDDKISYETTNSIWENTNLSLGKHKIEVIAIKKDNTTVSEIQEIEVIGIKPQQIYNLDKEVRDSTVRVKVEQYNKRLGIFKKDEKLAYETGIICQKKNNQYIAVCYCPNLKNGKTYDVTKISVTDNYGNEYEATEITPTQTTTTTATTKINDRILTVITFTATKKTLPVVDLGLDCIEYSNDLFTINNADVHDCASGEEKRPAKRIQIDGKQTVCEVIEITTPYKDNVHVGDAVFDIEKQFIGIIVLKTDEKIVYMQLKEILGYIDNNLQKECVEHRSGMP